MSSNYFKVILILSFNLILVYCESECDKNIGVFNHTYNLEISRGSPALYLIPLNLTGIRNPDIPTMRFEATVDHSADPKFPVLFSVTQFEEVTMFQLPYLFGQRGSSVLDYSGGRTLCTLKEYYSSARNITIRITTSSPTKIKVSFSLSISFEILQANGFETNFALTPASPRVYKYFWKNDADTVRIIQVLVTSSDNSCATLSIQEPYCPIHDELQNIEFDGYWQTMSSKGVMTISKRDFSEGFAIVIAQHKDGTRCTSSNAGLVSSSRSESFIGMLQKGGNSTRSKNISLVLLNRREFSMGFLFLACLIPVLLSFGIILIACGLFHQRHNWLSKRTHDAMNTNQPNNNEADVETSIMLTTTEIGTNSSVESNETSMRKLRGKKASALIDSSIWKVRADVNVMTLKKKEHRELMKDSNKFYWTIIIVSIFYAIPVYQLILNYLRIVKRTGEYDICYYNYLCSHRLWIFNDFNHFWSNVSYVVFGLAFNFIVGRRERNLNFSANGSTNARYQTTEEEGGAPCCQLVSFLPRHFVNWCCAPIIHVNKDCGIPSHFGVYYAMGLALIMEGVLSAAYHLCPNQSNFQFDTCFMYVISVLTILKVYQFRHPIHIGANQTFAILAAFALISVVGLILEINSGESGNLIKAFRWTFIVMQLLTMFILSVHYYAIGYVKDDRGNAISDWTILLHLDQLPKTVQLDRLLFPILSIFLSLGVIIYSELTETHFATYLLYALIANVLSSCIYYIGIMKPLHHEFQDFSWIQPAFYFLAAGVIGGISIRYFLTELTRWEISPSQSRALNEECSYSWFPFLPFYDNHDIWHFFSACALFCAFMGLLIVDDDILTTPQTKIAIF